ncbi:MAG: fibronectin type III domain-containing protein [Caldilinea sp.]|nr:fibronectin type III domain-containing protein [Caldilinea sp.]
MFRQPSHRRRSASNFTSLWIRLGAVLVLVLAATPFSPVRAQDGATQPDTPLTVLIAELETAPRLTLAPVLEDATLPLGMTIEELAQMPDRTKFALLDYEVNGDSILARVQLPASQTTFIASGQPNTNFAGGSTIDLGWDQRAYNAMRILIQFDLGALPANASIRSATFYAYQSYINPPGDGQGMDFRAQFMQQSWSASSVTWNNANYLGGQSLPLGTLPPVIGWISGGATEAVNAWRSGQPNNGLLITGDETPARGRWRQLSSRAIPQLAPYLLVEYEQGSCDTQPPIATMNALPSFEPSEFRVEWSAFDPDQPGCRASGVAWYNVRYRINGGEWVNWKNQSTATSQHFKGWAPNNSLVEIQVQAQDHAGNLGAWSAAVSTRIDSEPPVASVNPLPPYTATPTFLITWSGTDNLSGIDYYNLQMTKNGGPWVDLLTRTNTTSYQITGQQGDVFGFRVQAVDRVGNVQPWSPNAQATTTIFGFPIATMNPINPPIIKPFSPVKDQFLLSWRPETAPGTQIIQYEVRYRYTNFSGSSTGWTTWRFLTGSPPDASAEFPFTSMGMGNGVYDFYVLATNSMGQTQPFEPNSGRGASAIVDLDDVIQPQAYMPIMAR